MNLLLQLVSSLSVLCLARGARLIFMVFFYCDVFSRMKNMSEGALCKVEITGIRPRAAALG